MAHGTVKGQCRAHPDPHHHESELVDHAVGQHTAQVVFDHSEKDRIAGHDCAYINEYLRTRKSPGHGIDGHLGGKGTKEHCTRGCGSRVSIGDPVV